MSRVGLKQKAKKSLQGKYKETIKLLLFYFLINFAVGFVIGTLDLNEDMINLLSSIISLIIEGLLYFGYCSFFLKISRDEEVTYKELLSRTDLFLPFIGISLLIGILTFFGTLLFIIPGIIISLNYSMVYFVVIDNPELGVSDVLRKSKDIMKGHRMDFFILILSFFGWLILGIFTLGILYLWVIPYMLVTFANFYNEIKD